MTKLTFIPSSKRGAYTVLLVQLSQWQNLLLTSCKATIHTMSGIGATFSKFLLLIKNKENITKDEIRILDLCDITY